MTDRVYGRYDNYCLLLGDSEGEGIEVEWDKDSEELTFSGWYDGCRNIPGETLTLREFCGALGISDRALRDVIKGRKADGRGSAARRDGTP